MTVSRRVAHPRIISGVAYPFVLKGGHSFWCGAHASFHAASELRAVIERTRVTLEVEDYVQGSLEVVLGLIEECGVDPVGFPRMEKREFMRKSRPMPACAQEHYGCCSLFGAASARTHQRMGPGLEAVAAPADSNSTAAAEIFHMFILENCGSKTGDEVALDGEPAVGEVADRGVGATRLALMMFDWKR